MSVNKIKVILSITIFSFVLFLGVGYAAISKNLELETGVTGQTQDEVFITDISGTSTGGTLNSNSFIASLLTSKVTLNNTSSTATFTIQVYNNASVPYTYIGTNYGSSLGYDNSNIKFKLSIVEGDWVVDTSSNYANSTSVVPAKSYKTFTITFSHTKSGSNLSLSSVLKFLFVPLADTQVVTLIYNNNTYRDCFLKTETVATFPDVTVSPTTTANNVARCNGNAVATYSSGQIKVNNVYSDVYASSHSVTANNSTNSIKCQVYNSFTNSLRDASFEASNYTRNNFLVLNDITDSNATAEIPANSSWYVDLNGKTISYKYNNKMMKLTNKSRVYINTVGTINCGNDNAVGSDFAAIAEINNTEAVLQLSGGGTYTCQSGGDAILLINGKLAVRWVNITNYGNIFRIGLEPSVEKTLSGDSAAGTKNNVTLDVYSSTIKSTAANVVHSTSRQKVFATFVNSNLTAYNTVFLFNNKGVNENTEEEPALAIWENVQCYVTGGTVEGRAHDFFTHGARLYYTEAVSFPATAYPSVSNGFSVTGTDQMLAEGKENYAVLNYTSLTTEDWFYVKDSSGNRMKTSGGVDIKVGDKLEFLSKANTTYSLDVPGASYGIGKTLQIYTDNDSKAQRWTFIISDSSGYYHLSTYRYPTYILFTHEETAVVDMRNVNTYHNSSNSYWREWAGAKFSIYKQSGTGYYTFVSIESAANYYGVDKKLVIDVKNANMANGTIIQAYHQNDSDAQIWKINK